MGFNSGFKGLKNVCCGTLFRPLRMLSDAGESSATEGNWEGHINHVRTMEEAYYTRDGVIFYVMHRVIISNQLRRLSGDSEDTAILPEDTNSDSSN